jgi:pimeloyl-ACP methyl ester carboxylesterase
MTISTINPGATSALEPPLLAGLSAAYVTTPRLRIHVIQGGEDVPVIFLHGNLSAARFWEQTLVALPAGFRGIAPDLRGFGRSATLPVDATRGMRDFADDLDALIEALALDRPHLVGWSLGGCVVMQYAIDHPERVRSLTLIAPGSPYGFGGTRDLAGTPTAPDFAGSGAGMVNPEFVKRVAARDRSADGPTAPRNVMNARYFRPPFRSEREEIFVDEILTTAVADTSYPGDSVPVSGWPGAAPGALGVANALSPRYLNLSSIALIQPQPPILWIRGDADEIVSDTSTSDIAYLGQLGLVPDWPGPERCPPQPMVAQTRAVLERYAANGGSVQEVVIRECGHSPHIEQPAAFEAAFRPFLAAQSPAESGRR